MAKKKAADEQPKGELITNETMDFDPEALKAIMLATEDNVDSSEVIYSRMTILQLLSPEVKKKLPGYEFGQLIDNQNRLILTEYGKSPWLEGKVPEKSIQEVHFARFLPCFKLPTEFIHWKDRSTEGTGMHWKTTDPQDPRVIQGTWPPRGHWQPEEIPGKKTPKHPPVTENINVLGTFVDKDGNAIGGFTVATFARTSFSTGKKLVTACQTSGKVYWDRIHYLYTQVKSYEDDNLVAVIQLAEGPKSDFVDKGVIYNTYKMACYLAAVDVQDRKEAKSISRERQLGIINAASLEDQESASPSTADDTVDADAAFADDDTF